MITRISRPSPNTRRVGRGSDVLARDQNDTAQAISVLQAIRNGQLATYATAWATYMLHAIVVVQVDYLQCVRVWRGATLGAETVYISFPELLKNLAYTRGTVTYTPTGIQTRIASDGSNPDETQTITPTYLAGDLILADPTRHPTGVLQVDEQRRGLVDRNVDGRSWGTDPPPP